VSSKILDGFHAEHPLETGAPLQWLRSRLDAPDDVATALLAELSAEGRVVVAQGLVTRAGFSPSLSAAQFRPSTALMASIAAAGAEPPTIDELATHLGSDSVELMSLARWHARDGALIAVEPNRYFARAAVDELKGRMAVGMADGRDYTPAELRDLLGLTRKFLIPFLEHCDRDGYTIRTGLGRRLMAPSQ
jgi:selenocysteine-specific elongation factor